MVETVTETANNPTDASTSSEASTTIAATAPVIAGTEQQQAAPQGTQPTTEGSKPEEKTPPESKPEGAPESYDFKAPEGKDYDNALLGNFSEAAKEANLTQDAAQKFLDKVAPAVAARQAEQIEAIKSGWSETTKADKEIGGEKLQENLGFAKKALDTFGTPELRTLLEQTGLGNHPEVIRAFVKTGKAISQDTFVSGNPNMRGSVNVASVLYDNTTKKE